MTFTLRRAVRRSICAGFAVFAALGLAATGWAQAPAAPGTSMVLHLPVGDVAANAGGQAGSMQVFFNPKELSVDKSVPWGHGPGKGEGDAPTLEFTEGDPYNLQVELMFDGFESAHSVTDIAASLSCLVPVPPRSCEPQSSNPPPPIAITWGRRLWTSRLLSVTTQFTEWGPNGDPTRAVATTLWSSFDLASGSTVVPFAVSVQGLPETSKHAIRKVEIDPLTIDPREPGNPGRVGFNPPAVRRVAATLTFAETPGVAGEIDTWIHESARPGRSRRSVIVTIFDDARLPARTYAMTGCLVTRHGVDHPQAAVPYAVVSVVCDQASLQDLTGPSGNTPNTPAGSAGFEVSIEGAGGTGTAFFKSVGGLKTDTDADDYDQGGVGPGPTRRPDPRLDHLDLIDPPTHARPLFIQWVNDAIIGRPWKATLTITELVMVNGRIQRGRTWRTPNFSPRGFVFGDLSAIDSTGHVTEVIRVGR